MYGVLQSFSRLKIKGPSKTPMLNPSKSEWSDLFEEKERKSLIDREVRDLWISKNIGLSLDENYDSFQTAKKVFDFIDKDKSGYISIEEIKYVGRDTAGM